ncbi:uncharacterized protein LOC106169981 [Lingula anatina]|uniref:Uncharacterized protein LOC106169981 n=1 Tax=Lingula anatina TaxID=7574 RepID=A0A1S3J5L8_LINAN|nr:uncharacterized protein LOC106169981 [Lingula anatina]|eukprot:XP_013405129.1 uncharacterized protein LOC106169981 [Lingula anatina]
MQVATFLEALGTFAVAFSLVYCAPVNEKENKHKDKFVSEQHNRNPPLPSGSLEETELKKLPKAKLTHQADPVDKTKKVKSKGKSKDILETYQLSPSTYVDFSPRAVAEFLLGTQDFEGFFAALEDLQNASVMSPKEVELYKERVAWEYVKALQDEENYMKLAFWPSFGRSQARTPRPPKHQALAEMYPTVPDQDKKDGKPLPTKPTTDIKQEEVSTDDTSTDGNDGGQLGTKIGKVPPSLVPNEIAQRLMNDYALEDQIINALLYDWLTGKIRRGEKNPVLSFDDFLQYLQAETQSARQRHKDDVARVMELLTDALVSEYKEGVPLPEAEEGGSDTKVKAQKESKQVNGNKANQDAMKKTTDKKHTEPHNKKE